MTEVEKYLREQVDLISFLAEIPSVKQHVERIIIQEKGKELFAQVPNDLVMGYYLDTTGKSIRILYTWFESNIGVDKWDDFYNYLTLR
jgi:hypothetical protein